MRETEAFTAKDGWLYITGDAETITDYSKLCGGWIAVMITDPDGETITDFMNITISGTASKAKITMNWAQRYFHNGGLTVDDSGNSSEFSGSFSGGTAEALGPGKITITDFVYDYGTGKEYATGVFIWPDGVKGYIGLTR